MLIVQKFGGSSLATPEQILAVAQKVAALYKSGKKIILVTSAMGKTTDQLTSLAYQISRQPHRRELDMLLTTGERVSMALMAMALNDLGCPAISFTGSQAGIMTNGEFSNSNITALKPLRVEQALNENKIVVLAGFQGVDPETKEITTLGRGGSDTTAVAMAAHFKADRCEILKDVDGVYSADPKIVPHAYLHKRLSIGSLYEFCFWGAKVLNYKSVAWARDHQVPLFVGRSDNFMIGTEIILPKENSFAAYASETGTLLGVNSHAQVIEISVNENHSEAAQNILSRSLKSEGLSMPQILSENFTANQWRALMTSDKDLLMAFREFIAKQSFGKILREGISTVTATYVDRPSETQVVPSPEREAAIQKYFT